MSSLALPPPLASDERFALLCELLEEQLAGIDLTPMLVYLIDTVGTDLLPLLAEQFSMLDETVWSLAESEDARRALVKGATSLHRYKGTPWSLRELCRRLGLGEIQILERLSGQKRDGSILRDGTHVHGDPSAWAKYRVYLQQPITNDQASKLRRALIEHAPARCNLVGLDYQAVANRHNGEIRRDGQYNRGSA